MLCAALTGCGYTVLKRAVPAESDTTAAGPGVILAAEDSSAASEQALRSLPPEHPRILTPEDWIGRSFLDDLVGEDDPLRFENMRQHPFAAGPSEHATLTFRITLGGPALTEIWQIRMDQFGWVTAAYWTQGGAGPVLDETLATRRAQFRLARESETALRAMVLELFPEHTGSAQVRRPDRFGEVPAELWPYEDPGRIEIEYHIETLTAVDPDEWPGGTVSAPLDLTQLLIGTWDSTPPEDLRHAIRRMARERPLLMSISLLAEGVVLAWEVEGRAAEEIDLPLWVGR